MKNAYLNIGHDLDQVVQFINLNVTSDPNIIGMFQLDFTVLPQIYMLGPISNYTLIPYTDDISFYNFVKNIKTYYFAKMV